MKHTLLALPPLLVLAMAVAAEAEKPSPVGYSDTPLIPGSKWKVHDIDRPAPPVVKPGAKPGDVVIIPQSWF